MIGNYKNFNAAILVKQNQPLVVEEINLPDTLDVGQVLVKVHVSGICGSQIGEITGAKGDDPYLPHLLLNMPQAEIQNQSLLLWQEYRA